MFKCSFTVPVRYSFYLFSQKTFTSKFNWLFYFIRSRRQIFFGRLTSQTAGTTKLHNSHKQFSSLSISYKINLPLKGNQVCFQDQRICRYAYKIRLESGVMKPLSERTVSLAKETIDNHKAIIGSIPENKGGFQDERVTSSIQIIVLFIVENLCPLSFYYFFFFNHYLEFTVPYQSRYPLKSLSSQLKMFDKFLKMIQSPKKHISSI